MKFKAQLTQYMFPTGEPRTRVIELPEELKEDYDDMTSKGFRLEGEVLSTGVASTTVSKDVVDVDMKLTKATTEEAFKAIEKMLKARRWNEHQV